MPLAFRGGNRYVGRMDWRELLNNVSALITIGLIIATPIVLFMALRDLAKEHGIFLAAWIFAILVLVFTARASLG